MFSTLSIMGPKSRKPSDTEEFASILKEIRDELKSLNDRMSNIEDKVAGMEDSLSHHTDIVQELASEVTGIKSALPDLKTKDEHRDELILDKTVEIQGIPQNDNESLNNIITTIAEKRNCAVTADHIDLAYRNKSKKSIVVHFIQTHRRNDFLKCCKSKDASDRLTAKDLGFQRWTDRVFVSDYLSFENRQLFFPVREFKRSHDYKFAWSRGQQIYLKKTSESEAIRVKNLKELEQLSSE